MQNCLGEMLAMEQSLPVNERQQFLHGEDEEVAHEFCGRASVSFECACKACKPENLTTWDNDYWTLDRAAKKVIKKMRKAARCDELHQHGIANFPPGHGCFNLYKTACEQPLKSDWCPAVLDPNKFKTTRYGVAGTLLNDHTAYINPEYTCRTEMGRDRERDCKTKFKHSYHDGNAYCQPMHNFIKCMCNACEHDVETLVAGFGPFSRCTHLTRVKDEDPLCEDWWMDECENRAGQQPSKPHSPTPNP